MDKLIQEISNQLDINRVSEKVTEQQKRDFESNTSFNMILHEQEGKLY